jgi:hypothetical protein
LVEGNPPAVRRDVELLAAADRRLALLAARPLSDAFGGGACKRAGDEFVR